MKRVARAFRSAEVNCRPVRGDTQIILLTLRSAEVCCGAVDGDANRHGIRAARTTGLSCGLQRNYINYQSSAV